STRPCEFHKKCLLPERQTTHRRHKIPDRLLHFTRKFNLAIQSRFPDFRINAFSPLLIHSRRFLSAPQIQFSSFVQWDLERSLLCYSDRIVQDSHLIPSSVRPAGRPALHMFYMELYCVYITTVCRLCQTQKIRSPKGSGSDKS